MKRWEMVFTVVLVGCCTTAMAARIRPGGDPAKERMIWADPFDNWSTEDHALGRLWQGGPWPPGSPAGTWPSKYGCGAHPDNDWLTLYYRGNLSPDNDCTNLSTPFGLMQSRVEAWVDANCGLSGELAVTQPLALEVNSVWQPDYNTFTPLGMFTYDIRVNRLNDWVARSWDAPNGEAVNGTDEHPLTLIFYLSDKTYAGQNPRDLFANCYVELNLDGDHAPTDYIWRGNPTAPPPGQTDPEYCPQGPYPIICQQVRELNGSVSENADDVAYLNAHCPPLVPPFDPETGQGKTWKSIAFGFLAIGDKDPCGLEEQGVDSHRPTKDHMMLFDGNKWRELRSGRGTALTQCPPPWGTNPPGLSGYNGPETTMQEAGTGSSGNFSLTGGFNTVYLKLTSTKILIYHANGTGATFCGAFPRIYTGPFNRISFGVAPGCQLKDREAYGDAYECDPNGTPKQCLRYSTTFAGYDRMMIDSALLLDGIVQGDIYKAACCHPNGTCEFVDHTTCSNNGGTFRGVGTTCDGTPCLGACCQPMGICEETSLNDCPNEFKGYGTSCSTADICPCPTIKTDADWDGDVDQADFAIFQACYTGPDGGGNLSSACKCLDLAPAGGDDTIDQDDYAAFEECASGSGIATKTGC
jgi:hypothetical protein